MAKLTLAEMKAKTNPKSYFWSEDTMRFYSGAKYYAKYSKKTNTNFIMMTQNVPEVGNRTAWWSFDEKTGHYNSINEAYLPPDVR